MPSKCIAAVERREIGHHDAAALLQVAEAASTDGLADDHRRAEKERRRPRSIVMVRQISGKNIYYL